MSDRECEVCRRKESDGYELRTLRSNGMTLCSKHRAQLRRHGKFLNRTRFDNNEIIVNSKEEFAEVLLYNKNGEEINRTIIDLDSIDIVKQYKWSLKKKGNNYYVRTTVNGEDIMLHKLLTNTNSDTIVDHVNRNTLDNRISNLRIASHSQNNMNKSLQSNNTSGVTGVRFDKNRNKWVAKIKKDGKTIHLGYFTNKDDAIRKRLLAEKKLFKEFSPQKHLCDKYDIGDDLDEV